MSEAQNLVLSELKPGDELPPLGYDVTATTVVLGALATRDWRPMHHDYDFAVNRNGVKNIFVNTPNQAAWFERYITGHCPHWLVAYGKTRTRFIACTDFNRHVVEP